MAGRRTARGGLCGVTVDAVRVAIRLGGRLRCHRRLRAAARGPVSVARSAPAPGVAVRVAVSAPASGVAVRVAVASGIPARGGSLTVALPVPAAIAAGARRQLERLRGRALALA